MLAEIGKVMHHGLMHETRATGPRVFESGVRNHWHVFEVGECLGPCSRQRMQVQVMRTARSPVKRDRPTNTLMRHMLDDRLDGCKTGTTGQQNDRLLAVFSQEK